MDYRQLAAAIVDNIGGKENVIGVVHCATRLRFTLRDESKANTDALKKTKGVMTVVSGGGQYQVVIGPDVPQVYQEVIAIGGFEAKNALSDKESEKEDGRSGLSKVLEGIASIFQPIIPAITGAGLIKAFMALFVALGWLGNGTQTYIILNAMADAAFYFMPILLAVSCARKFKCNQGTAMALAGILVYPGFIGLLGGEEAVKFLTLIPITKANYASSVIPIILGVWFMSYVEKCTAKISPRPVKFFTVPLVSILVGGTVTIAALGPLGAWVSDLINVLFTWMNKHVAWLVPTVVGVFNPFLVMTGTHYGLIPIGTNNLATVKWDTVVGPGMLVSNVAQGAAGLAVGVRSKNAETKQQASSAGLTGLLGITEPVLYGVNLKFSFPLYAAMIGGGLGGLYLGIMRVARFAGGSPGLLVLPAYIPTADVEPLGYTMTNLTNAVIGVVIAIVAAFIASYIMFGIWAKKGKLDPEETRRADESASGAKSDSGKVSADSTGASGMRGASDEKHAASAPGENGKIFAPIIGEVVRLENVQDEVFSSGAMGPGIAIIPEENAVYAPCDGTISTFFPTGHAIGICSADGAEILIHVGMDTVKLDGKGFTPFAKQGDTVKRGQLLLRFDIGYIKSQNLPIVTPVILTNADAFKSVSFAQPGNITLSETVMTYEK